MPELNSQKIDVLHQVLIGLAGTKILIGKQALRRLSILTKASERHNCESAPLIRDGVSVNFVHPIAISQQLLQQKNIAPSVLHNPNSQALPFTTNEHAATSGCSRLSGRELIVKIDVEK